MNEPIVRAQAGRPPAGIIRRALGLLEAFVTYPYAPNPNDARRFGYDPNQYVTIDAQALADYEIPAEFALIRIGGSASVRDTKFKHYWATAKAAKTPRSIYTYTWPGWTVSQHIENFMASVELWTPGDLGEGPIWVDVETHAGKSRRHVSLHAYDYIRSLESETGKVVGAYSAKWFIDGYMEPQDWMKEILWWLATYATGREHPGPPAIPNPIPVSNVVIHQTGSKCNSALFGGSGTFDTDRWTGSESQFRQLFNIEEPDPPDPDLEIRLAHLELQVKDNQREIERLSEWKANTDDWGNSYGE